ncbi:MAG: hypothetical protein ABS85_05065 [Sphingobacteriales bacterium SCN 48-20]|uniref:outer membrane beta-barrel protein n=1 Tax=Terrimonas ferruginea TaxID=249 RepID=UPI00086F7050|nr:outer membrane beta-barrel protein [Terrimonas ferruginea]MBN8785042.1 outer membrane beta-barrel protein [Terrimonas ferruginea]ODT93814.1 MAG: hypothetical protein ABS85_05065 [Sphingobacteriales bacterium SCN 48-20]OJW43306.1 MAG: hypothetical protein BGO56_06745 [Sphingobacteriales bacterium 48-107]
MFKKLLLFLLVTSFSLSAFSQGSVKGKLLDSANKQPLALATVTVFKAADTAIVTYRLSSPDGDFRVPGLPLGIPLRMVVSFSGYGVYRHEFTATSDTPVIDLGNVYLEPNATSLDEVLVVSERPPVTIKKDTIEFNASAFKTLPNALVEDLLKKLPGVQVDADGNITVNGKPVNRLLVDGKAFFGDDPKMATRNLPANVIDKVQVADDKDEMLRNGDDNINNVGKVINITLKKGVKKGWFGKVYAGAGTESRYEAGGIANIYRDTLQVSILGYANNLNRPGFSYSELMQTGGLDRSRGLMGSNSTSIWRNNAGSGINLNGVSFGGLTSYGGISTSKGAGFNLNHSPNSKQSIFAQYFFGNVVVDRINTINSQQFSGDTVITNNNRITGDVVTNAHNFGVGARLKPDSVTTILANASYMIGKTDEDRISAISSDNNKLGPLSSGNIYQNNLNNTYYYKHMVNIVRLSRKKANRRLVFTNFLDINNKFTDFLTESETRYLYPILYDSAYSQLRLQRMPSTTTQFIAGYSEPITKWLISRNSVRYEYEKVGNGVRTLNKDSDGKFEVPNETLTNDFNRENNRVVVSSGLEFKIKGLTITPAARLQWQNINNRLQGVSPVVQRRTDLLPSLAVVYKQLNLSYTRDVVLPGYMYLLPVTDNSNPYFITRGNTSLQPSDRHSVQFSGYTNDAKRNLYFNFYTTASLTNNDFVQHVQVDDKGVQTTTPMNADGSQNASINFNVSKQYKYSQRFTFSWNTGAWGQVGKNRFMFNEEASWQRNLNMSSWSGINLNFNDKVEFNSSYSINYQRVRNTNEAFREISVVAHWWENQLTVRWPKHVFFENALNYSYNSSIGGGLPKDVLRWNAAVNFTFLPGDAGVLKIGVQDILNRNTNIWVQTNRNMITTSSNNVLGRYLLATFTYNIRPSMMKKKPSGNRFFLWD